MAPPQIIIFSRDALTNREPGAGLNSPGPSAAASGGLFLDLGDGSTVAAVSTDGLRMLRSAPAMDLSAVAAGVGMRAWPLRLAAERLRGRGCCDQLAASLVSWRHSTEGRRVRVLRSRVCPPFAARCAAWDRFEHVSGNAAGVAGWSARGVDSTAAARAAYARDVAAASDTTRCVEQPGCPPAMAARLATGHPNAARRLAAVTPHSVALAALVTASDDTTRRTAAGRGDLPPALAAAAGTANDHR